MTWFAGPVDGVEVALPSTWHVADLTAPGWRVDVERAAVGVNVDPGPLVPPLDAARAGGGLVAAVDLAAWRGGAGPVIAVGREPARGATLDEVETGLRDFLAGQDVEQLEFNRVSNDEGTELVHVTYGLPANNVFQTQFVAFDSYSYAWSLSLSAPSGPDLVDQATLFDEVAAATVVG